MKALEFTVHGRPVPAVRMTQRSKWVDPRAKKYLAYKEQVGWAAKVAGGRQLPGPVRVDISLYIKDKRVGDVDNYAKSVLDGLNKILWNDDRQVVELHVYRHKGARQRADVRVQALRKKGRDKS